MGNGWGYVCCQNDKYTSTEFKSAVITSASCHVFCGIFFYFYCFFKSSVLFHIVVWLFSVKGEASHRLCNVSLWGQIALHFERHKQQLFDSGPPMDCSGTHSMQPRSGFFIKMTEASERQGALTPHSLLCSSSGPEHKAKSKERITLR